MLIRTMYALFVAALFIHLPAAGQETAGMTGFRAEFTGMFQQEADKVLQLAGAIPEDKYSWRPQEGVRSIREVYLHIAGANVMFPAMISGEKIDFDAIMAQEKKEVDKNEVKMQLTSSIENIKKMVMNMTDADLEKPVTIPFIPLTTTTRGVLMIIMSHMSEHLGQSIAYARMVNVTPPWTAAQKESGGY